MSSETVHQFEVCYLLTYTTIHRPPIDYQPLATHPPPPTMQVIMDMYCRPDPSKPVLWFTGEGSASTGLVEAFKRHLPTNLSSIHRRTMERMIERVVEERNLMGVLAATKDHNVCALCKSWQVSVTCIYYMALYM